MIKKSYYFFFPFLFCFALLADQNQASKKGEIQELKDQIKALTDLVQNKAKSDKELFEAQKKAKAEKLKKAKRARIRKKLVKHLPFIFVHILFAPVSIPLHFGILVYTEIKPFFDGAVNALKKSGFFCLWSVYKIITGFIFICFRISLVFFPALVLIVTIFTELCFLVCLSLPFFRNNDVITDTIGTFWWNPLKYIRYLSIPYTYRSSKRTLYTKVCPRFVSPIKGTIKYLEFSRAYYKCLLYPVPEIVYRKSPINLKQKEEKLFGFFDHTIAWLKNLFGLPCSRDERIIVRNNEIDIAKRESPFVFDWPMTIEEEERLEAEAKREAEDFEKEMQAEEEAKKKAEAEKQAKQDAQGGKIKVPNLKKKFLGLEVEDRLVTTIHTDVIVNKETRQLEFVELGPRHTCIQPVLVARNLLVESSSGEEVEVDKKKKESPGPKKDKKIEPKISAGDWKKATNALNNFLKNLLNKNKKEELQAPKKGGNNEGKGEGNAQEQGTKEEDGGDKPKAVNKKGKMVKDASLKDKLLLKNNAKKAEQNESKKNVQKMKQKVRESELVPDFNAKPDEILALPDELKNSDKKKLVFNPSGLKGKKLKKMAKKEVKSYEKNYDEKELERREKAMEEMKSVVIAGLFIKTRIANKVNKYKIKPDISVMREAARYGQVETIKWLEETYNIKPDISVMREAGQVGFDAVVKFLAKEPKIKPDISVMREAARYGQIETIKWLEETYNIKPDLLMVRSALPGKYPRLANWLVGKYKIKPDKDLLFQAVKEGDLKFFKWLKGQKKLKFNVSAKELLKVALEHKQHELAKWLKKTYKIKEDSTQKDN